ncbi:FAD-binding oxidoreductase [Geoalkalibacter halelectricus]|uniref:FAD-binding protein n=1 Tax=Geoalkalibacter halelectricus TaxID=2847045 RepID=A0ABY5ZLV1_9BACT|nr:FAD-linked oxidase C-terminal domain-containing protein [Geoalkalibacter halelectricus]MDO3378604.1 FAD-binding protein [Geoalkalibacter halelectricus]UWZ80083.1 FAD-binding protein [Geoalkalibacter halelectricus]
MISSTAIAHLKEKLGDANVLHEKEDLLTLGYDSTPGVHHLPEVVVYPTSSEQVVAAMEIAEREGLPLTPRGSGTGLSGGSVPVKGGMVLCLTRMNRILEIDEENLTATAEAGVITLDLFNAVAAKGLFYPPDPGSQKISTLGGNVAENAGGLRGLKYGVTRDYVMALKGVLADRSLIATGGKSVKDVAGYGFKDLLVGSEGTLGIITEITVKLIPPPQDKRTILAYFDDVRTAGEAVSRIIAAKIIPSTMEIMDRAVINCVEDYVKIGLPRQMAALLLIEVDGHPAPVAEEAAGVRKILEEVKAAEIHVARDAEHAAGLAAARRTALSALARVSPTTLLEDATVPRSRLAETFGEIERLREKYQLKVGTFGHAGDGNLHPTVLCDERDHDEMARAHAFYNELYEQVLAWGGTVSGEHGIGLAKKEYLARQIGPGGVQVMKRIKQTFDPQGLLNPGKIFDEGDPCTKAHVEEGFRVSH